MLTLRLFFFETENPTQCFRYVVNQDKSILQMQLGKKVTIIILKKAKHLLKSWILFSKLTVEGTNEKPDLNFPLPGEKGPACLVKVCVFQTMKECVCWFYLPTPPVNIHMVEQTMKELSNFLFICDNVDVYGSLLRSLPVCTLVYRS